MAENPVKWEDLVGLPIPDIMTTIPADRARELGAEEVAAAVVGLLGEQRAIPSDVLHDKQGDPTGEIMLRTQLLSENGARRPNAGQWTTKVAGVDTGSTRGFFIHKNTVVGTADLPHYSTAPMDENWIQIRWESNSPNKPDTNLIYKRLETHVRDAMTNGRHIPILNMY